MVGEPVICAICHLPIEEGSGRYRTEEGDVHQECYECKYDKRARPGNVPNILSGVVHEVGEGFIVLSGGIRVRVPSSVMPPDMSPGTRVTVNARLRGAEWVAEDIVVKD